MELLLRLAPSVSEKVWGGGKLAQMKSIEGAGKIGETWEISSHSSGPSRLKINNSNLNDLVALKYLLKYIDTADNLSVQVHPDDDYAATHENEKGKTECWLVLEAERGAGIYLGFRPGVTKKEFKTALEAGMPAQNYLNFYEVRPGDFFVVPAGAVHAIGKGVTLVEAQQNSGVTYRVWDWNRMGDDGRPRELHLEKAMDVLRFDEAFNKQLSKMKKANVLENQGATLLFKHPEFKVELLVMRKGDKKEFRGLSKEGLTLLKGEMLVDGERFSQYESAICSREGMLSLEALENSALLTVQEQEG